MPLTSRDIRHPDTHLYNSIDGTGLLAEAAINTLGHINVVARRSSTSVLARFRLDRDGLSIKTKGEGQCDS